MDKLTHYQEIINNVFLGFQKLLNKEVNREVLLSMDTERGQYLLISDAWEEGRRYYQTLMHIELKMDTSVWLRLDATDLELGQTLINHGIARKDIVAAFYSETMRAYMREVL
ncbi:MAG: element excision factor XisI family protein [Bacteroidota bacterium]